MEDYNRAYIKAKEQQAQKHPRVSHKERQDRLPPGQLESKGFPILDLGIRPSLDRYPKWTLAIRGNVERPITLSIPQLKGLGGPLTGSGYKITADFHCVTRWSRFDLHWTGIPFQKIIDQVKPKPSATYVVFHSFDGYTTNVPLEELRKPNVIVAYELEGEEIVPEHGGPIRMVIPQLYGWKSAKFLTAIEFLDQDQPGFWEVRGYSNRARPWIEERYND